MMIFQKGEITTIKRTHSFFLFRLIRATLMRTWKTDTEREEVGSKEVGSRE